MSLVPYHPQEGREIVLHHRNAIVVHDPTSQRLEIRGVAECPTCHRPLRSPSPERSPFGEDSHHGNHAAGQHGYTRHEGYVDPNYFRLLRAGHHVGQLRASPAPSSPPSGPGARSPSAAPQTGATNPLRRLFQPAAVRTEADADGHSVSSMDSEGFDGLAAHAHAVSSSTDVPPDAEFVSSTPYVAPDAANPINKDAFSPNYFRTFFVEERELGRGGKGVVLLVRHEIDGCQLGYFACKRVPVGDDHAWLERVLVEVELLAKLSHPNLVSYRHVWLENVTLNRFGPRVACAFILQQYCNGGDLHRYIVGDQPKEATKEELKARRRRLSKGQAEHSPELHASYRHLAFDEIYSLFKDITSGLAYLHAANYIHRDLKPSNCLLHREGRILTCLISDFGEVQAKNVARNSTGTTGTISYCAPEVLRQDPITNRYGNFTTKSDIFSLGMILYFMCFGRLPYRSANALNEELEDVDQLRAEISDWKGFHYERRERPDLPSKLYQLLMRMLSASPAERPSANEVLLAMRTESSSSLDSVGIGIPRSASSSASVAPPVGLSGRRIQNLDSPLPSGTPVPDPTKTISHLDGETQPAAPRFEDWDEAAIDDSDDLPSPFLRSSVRNGIPHPGHRPSTSLTLTRGHASHGNSSRSPDPGGPAMGLRGGGSSSSGGTGGSSTAVNPGLSDAAGQTSPLLSPRRRPNRQHGVDEDENAPIDESNHAPARLAPDDGPATPAYLLMPPPTTGWGEARYRAALFFYRHCEATAFVLRTALFLAKMASLTRPCWPFAVRFGVGTVLVVLAALDLGMPRASLWDWRGSMILLVVHVSVLGLAARGRVLCTATSPETWDTWQQ